MLENIKHHQQPLTLSSRQLNLRRRHRRHRSKHRPDRLRGRSLQRRQVRARSRHRVGCHLTAERGKEREINSSSRERGENEGRAFHHQGRMSTSDSFHPILVPMLHSLGLPLHLVVPTRVFNNGRMPPTARRSGKVDICQTNPNPNPYLHYRLQNV
jgi:hypothetical protein